MRLATRHQGSWLGLQDCGIAEVARIPGRFGSAETVQLGAGDPIVLLPGLAGGWRLLAPLARILARRHRVILVGLRGDGSAGGGAVGQTPGDHARDVADLISDLGLERPTVLGTSYGGAIALELSLRYPRSVGALALFGAEARFAPTMGSAILLRALERFPLPRTSPFLNQFFNVLHGCRPDAGPMVDFIVQRCWETDQGVVASRLRGLEGFDVSERLWEIDAPTLVVAGAKDVVVAPARQKAITSRLPDATFATLDGAGHVGFLTHRTEVATLVSRFVRRRVASCC
jgi:pimeloyl-ACP methyl ester carboxylesterase